MKSRRTLPMMLAIALIILITSAITGSAQIVACNAGTYTVDIALNVHADCFPVVVKTSWGGGTWSGTTNTLYPGVFTVNPGASPGKPLDFIDVCGTTIPPTPGQTTVTCGTCQLCVVTCNDPSNGCLVIKIYLGPCPVLPLPCP